MITSSANAKVRQAVNLLKKPGSRKESGLFIAEGLRMFKELPKNRIDSVYVSESFVRAEENHKILSEYGYEILSDSVFNSIADTQTPQGILALVRQYDYQLQDLLLSGEPAFLVILEDIRDPGNLGTILRAAEGAGVTGVLMNRGTVDIYNPKVIRSTMGSVCRLPFMYQEDLSPALKLFKEKGIRLYAAHLNGRNNYEKEDYTDNTGFLIGNEAGGLSEKTAAFADELVKIPMKGKVESLNAAVAASVLMFETARQRRG